jgi:transposase
MPTCGEPQVGELLDGTASQKSLLGARPRQPADQRYESGYLFGAVCPVRGVGPALALPFANTEASQLRLEEISRHVAEGAHAVLLLDRAGWHITAKLDMLRKITPIFLPSRAPELNPQENIWQFMRGNWLSNLVFDTYDDIIALRATLGANSSQSQRPSPPSACEIEPTSVRPHDSWC